MARFFCFPNPCHSSLMSFAPKFQAISTVPSVEPESTTTISVAQRTLSSVRGRFASSFLVMIATERVFPIQAALLFQGDRVNSEMFVDEARDERLEQSAVFRQYEVVCFIRPVKLEACGECGDPYLAHRSIRGDDEFRGR